MHFVEDFFAQLKGEGFIIGSHSPDKINRCTTESNRSSNNKPAWFFYSTAEGKEFGIYGDFRTNEKHYYPHTLTPEQKLIYQQALSPAENTQIEAMHWNHIINTSPPVGTNPYFETKQINPDSLPACVRMENDGVLIPIYHIEENVCCGIEKIYFDGHKKSLPGTKKGIGAFCFQGNKDKYLVCEGFSTGYSLWQGSGHTVFVAFGSNSVANLTRKIRAKTQAPIIVCGDHDTAGLKLEKETENIENCSFIYPSIEGADFNDIFCQYGVTAVSDYFNMKGFTGLIQQGYKEIVNRWLIKDYLAIGSIFTIIGPPQHGKSFFALHLASCILSSQKFFGRTPTQRGALLYVAGEDFFGINNRFKALDETYNINQQNLYLTKDPVYFLTPDSIEELLQNVEYMKIQSIPLTMIIIDTMNTNFGAGDENSTKDMTAFFNSVRRIHKIYPECAIGIVHHTGHNDPDRGRGSSAILATVDTQFLVTLNKDTKIMTVKTTKVKNGPLPGVLEGKISSSHKYGLFEEIGAATVGDEFIKDVSHSIRSSQDENNKALAIRYALEHKCASPDNEGMVTKEEVVDILDTFGISSKHQSTMLDRLITQAILKPTAKDIYSLVK